MEQAIKTELGSLLYSFMHKAILETKKYLSTRPDIHPYNETQKFKYETTSSGNIQGHEVNEIFDLHFIHQLDEHEKSYNFSETHLLVRFILDNNIFPVNPEDANKEKFIFNRGVLKILIDFIERNNGLTSNKRKLTSYIEEYISTLESESILVEVVVVLPNIDFLPLSRKKIELGDGFILQEFTDRLKEDIVTHFIKPIINLTNSHIYFDKLLSSSVVLTKKFLVPKDSKSISYYNHARHLGGSPYRPITEEVFKGIEIIKKLKIYFGENIYISNIFYREGDSEGVLRVADWHIETSFDFFIPNMIFWEGFDLDYKQNRLKLFLRKFSVFNHKNYDIQFNRFLSGLDRKRSDKTNATLDFIILLESLLVDSESEISYQFSLYGSLFFEKNPSERKDLIKYFKALYNLRSKIIHGRNNTEIKTALGKLETLDSEWFKRLGRYCHQILLYIIQNNISTKQEFIEQLKHKINL